MKFSQIPKTFPSLYEQNIAIEKYVNQLDINAKISPSERDFIMRYSGKGQEFKKEEGLISEGLYEFYTPDYLSKLMWDLAYKYGYDGGAVLEPSCANGHIMLAAKPNTKITGIEVNPLTAKIAQLSFPESEIHNIYYEQCFLEKDKPRKGRWGKEMPSRKPTWLNNYPFSLVIGNPPYGKHSGLYASFIKSQKYLQVEFFFLLKSLSVLKKGGVLVFLTASNWLRNGHLYQPLKEHCESIATLETAYRTPPVFKNTGVPTDILVYIKK